MCCRLVATPNRNNPLPEDAPLLASSAMDLEDSVRFMVFRFLFIARIVFLFSFHNKPFICRLSFMCLVALEGGTFFSFFLRLIKKVHQFKSYNGYKKHKKSPVMLHTHTRTCQFRGIWLQKWRREYAHTHSRKETEQLHLMLHGEGESHSWLLARWSP